MDKHPVAVEPPVFKLSPNQRAWRRFCHNRLAVGGSLVLGGIILLAILLPWFSQYHPNASSDLQFSPPSSEHSFGTDVHGRDLLVRVCHGTRISLVVGAVGAVVSLVIGVIWGAVAGYLGGRWDNLMMRIVDILYSLPSIIFVIVLITTLEQMFRNWLARALSPQYGAYTRMVFLFAGLGAVSWLTMARIVRGQVLSLRTRGFVEASRALGASHARIIFRHILPNVYGLIIVYVALTVPAIVLSESFLSYLGLGIQPPQASLGSLIADGAGQINPIRIYWWLIVLPGGVLITLLLSLNFIGDGLRDALDPRAETE
jgi:peptide/nickel transport system permease protein/oligopeptide transport system permease protein